MNAAAGRVAAALCLLVGMTGIGATQVPSAEKAALCIPIIMDCSSPAPSPTQGPTLNLPGLIPAIPGVPAVPKVTTPGATAPVVDAVADPNAPVFTQPAAQMSGSSLSFTGLQSVSLVTVPTLDGSRVTVIKLVADSITINDFVLDVRRATGPKLVSTSDQMVLRGHVQAYVDSLSATLLNGTGISLLANTPIPGDELQPQLLRVSLGLVGVTASSISFANSHQHLYE